MSTLLLADSSVFTTRAIIRAFDRLKKKETSRSEITMSFCQYMDVFNNKLVSCVAMWTKIVVILVYETQWGVFSK
jgi:hypothetical protein